MYDQLYQLPHSQTNTLTDILCYHFSLVLHHLKDSVSTLYLNEWRNYFSCNINSRDLKGFFFPKFDLSCNLTTNTCRDSLSLPLASKGSGSSLDPFKTSSTFKCHQTLFTNCDMNIQTQSLCLIFVATKLLLPFSPHSLYISYFYVLGFCLGFGVLFFF